MELPRKNDKLFIWPHFPTWSDLADYLTRFWLFSLTLAIRFDLAIWLGYLALRVNLMRERLSNCGTVAVLESFVPLRYNASMS